MAPMGKKNKAQGNDQMGATLGSKETNLFQQQNRAGGQSSPPQTGGISV